MNEENKFFKWLEDKLLEPMTKISNTKFVRAMVDTSTAAIPLTIIGSIFLVLNVLPSAFPALKPFFESTILRFSAVYMTSNNATIGILSLFYVVGLGYYYTKTYAEDEGLNVDPVNGAFLSLMAYFMAIPKAEWKDGMMQLVNVISDDQTIVNGWEMGGSGPTGFSANNLFVAIIVVLLVVKIYTTFVRRNWVISMPDSVPDGVARAFSAILPGFTIALVMILVNSGLAYYGTDIPTLISYPFSFVTNLTNSWLGLLVIYFLISLLWIVGIHGANIILAFVNPIALANLAANIDGAVIPWAGSFDKALVSIGGSGATLGLAIFLLFFAKSDQLKTLGKATIVPSLFNINEPLIFGLPIIYNPYLAIPFILAPMASGTFAYFAIKWGWINPIVAQMPWPTPVGIGAFVSTGGDWKAVIAAFISVLISFAIYYPFAKAYDNSLLKQQAENEELQAE